MLRHTFTFRASSQYGWGKTNAPQVLGAAVPTFGNYPHLAQRVLTLYREFWRLVQLHHPDEQPDLAVRLRNEFRKGRLLRGTNQVNKAVQKAESELEFFKSIIDMKQSRFEGRAKLVSSSNSHTRGGRSFNNSRTTRINSRSSSNNNNNRMKLKATCSDGLWSELQNRGQGAVPGLANLRRSNKKLVGQHQKAATSGFFGPSGIF